MKITKTLRLSLNMLLHSKLRSWLTIIGIVIGVAAVVGIISIGQGLQANVQSQIGGLGQDVLTISSGSSRAGEFEGSGGGGGTTTNVQKLSTTDISVLKLIPGVKYIEGTVSGRADVVLNAEKASLSIQGIDPNLFKEFVTASLDSGRYLSQGESRSVVIGNQVATKVFKTTLQVGNMITIGDLPFKVVGILQSVSGFGGSDSVIYMPAKDARDALGSTLDLKINEFSSIVVKVDNADFIQDVNDKIDVALTNAHHLRNDKKDFSVFSPAALQQRFSQITGSITIFLGVLAAISLIVGGIGVANTMFTSVLEKTRDIGVMKAIGAKNSDIMLIFLFNSGMLGLVGGIIGIAFGALIAYSLPNLGLSFGPRNAALQTVISLNLLSFALGFSILIGMLSGVIPAYRASKLKPVEALRYE